MMELGIFKENFRQSARDLISQCRSGNRGSPFSSFGMSLYSHWGNVIRSEPWDGKILFRQFGVNATSLFEK